MEEPLILIPILVFLIVGIFSATLFRKIGLNAIIGYFIAGIIIGPYGLGMVEENETTRFLAELGVLFLLFDIGLHFSLQRLWDSRRTLLLLAPVQVILAAFVLGGTTYWMGDTLEISLIIGMGLALSSTAAVMQILSERSEQNSPLGNTAIGILIFQDILVVFLLILVQSLGSGPADLPLMILTTLIKVGAVLASVILLGRFVLGKVFDQILVNQNEEVFTATALLVVLSTAFVTGWSGLSLSLGAFLAGVLISESDIRHVMKAEIRPFRTLLLSFFFITVGMSLDLSILLPNIHWAAITVLGLFLLKALTLWAGARLLGFGKGFSLTLAFLLAQGSEFSFVLFTLAVDQGILPPPLGSLLIGVVGASLALTPGFAALGRQIGRYMEQTPEIPSPIETSLGLTDHSVLLAGFDHDGHLLARALESEGIEYLAIDYSSEGCTEARCEGFNVVYGDVLEWDLYRKAGAQRVKAVVILLGDPAASSLITGFSENYPQTPLLIQSSDLSALNGVQRKGIHFFFPKGDAGLLAMGECLLSLLEVPVHRIQDWKDAVRTEELDRDHARSAFPELP